MKRLTALTCLSVVMLLILSGCALFKSDEEKIEERIDSFVSAYNSGDFEEVLENLDSKTRNTFKSSIALTEALSGVSGFSISDLFGVGIGINEGDVLKVDIKEIEVDGDSATADVTVSYKDTSAELNDEAFFTMKKEKNDWYIKNFEDK